MSKAGTGTVRSAKDAEARFRASFQHSLGPALAPEDRAHVERLLRGAPSAVRVPCREARARIEQTLGVGSAHRLLQGSLADLDRPGACWELHWDGQLEAGLSAGLDASEGTVLVMWFTPEG